MRTAGAPPVARLCVCRFGSLGPLQFAANLVGSELHFQATGDLEESVERGNVLRPRSILPMCDPLDSARWAAFPCAIPSGSVPFLPQHLPKRDRWVRFFRMLLSRLGRPVGSIAFALPKRRSGPTI